MSQVFGIVPSRRLGRSLGISPIPGSTCTYSCVYCQLGRTRNMRVEREEFFNLETLMNEIAPYRKDMDLFDVITVVGEGEPTLYSRLGELAHRLKEMFDKPTVLITNGSLFFRQAVAEDAMQFDIVMPSIDAWDEESFKTINRPHGSIHFEQMFEGMKTFRRRYKGDFYLETMCMEGFRLENSINKPLERKDALLQKIKALTPDKVFINTPVRPPAEKWVKTCSKELLNQYRKDFPGADSALPESKVHSDIQDTYNAVVEIIKRHPLEKSDITTFCTQRKASPDSIIEKLKSSPKIETIEYNEGLFFRIKTG